MAGGPVPALHLVHLRRAKPLDESDQPADSADVGSGETAQCYQMTLYKNVYGNIFQNCMTIYSTCNSLCQITRLER